MAAFLASKSATALVFGPFVILTTAVAALAAARIMAREAAGRAARLSPRR
jgi:hypothetical protein